VPGRALGRFGAPRPLGLRTLADLARDYWLKLGVGCSGLVFHGHAIYDVKERITEENPDMSATKIDLFRVVNAQSPETMEKVITLWGSEALGVFVNDRLKESADASGRPLSADTASALTALIAEHNREFPQFAMLTAEFSAAHLAKNENYQIVLARIPRIAQRLDSLWGHSEFCTYVHELLNDSRGGSRQGFPDNVAVALFRLVQEHERDFPQYVKNVSEIWSVNNKII
jgi:hypothetical protein